MYCFWLLSRFFCLWILALWLWCVWVLISLGLSCLDKLIELLVHRLMSLTKFGTFSAILPLLKFKFFFFSNFLFGSLHLNLHRLSVCLCISRVCAPPCWGIVTVTASVSLVVLASVSSQCWDLLIFLNSMIRDSDLSLILQRMVMFLVWSSWPGWVLTASSVRPSVGCGCGASSIFRALAVLFGLVLRGHCLPSSLRLVEVCSAVESLTWAAPGWTRQQRHRVAPLKSSLSAVLLSFQFPRAPLFGHPES